MRRASLMILLAVVGAASACDEKGLAYGDANSIIAVMSPELWDEVSQDFYDVLEPTIQTVRNEKTFTVTYQDPRGEFWSNLRRFRQMVVVGTESDFWVAEALQEAPEPPPGPGLLQIRDVWSRGQSVTVILLSEPGAADEVREHLPEVHGTLDQQYRVYARNRMFQTGVDSALADTLTRAAGFRLLLPEVYRWRHTDSVYVFRNDNPDPSELIREITVTWRTPDRTSVSREELLAWRESLVEAHYSEPQDVVLGNASDGPLSYRGRDGYQLQAMWTNPPERSWPAGGPFITRMIPCPEQDRVYLVDAWLYAPGREKYEYMIQLETILDSFECGF